MSFSSVINVHIFYYNIIAARDIYRRICVAGGDSNIIESPTEPKWTSEGKCSFVQLVLN